jgi:hypothetical protein
MPNENNSTEEDRFARQDQRAHQDLARVIREDQPLYVCRKLGKTWGDRDGGRNFGGFREGGREFPTIVGWTINRERYYGKSINE